MSQDREKSDHKGHQHYHLQESQNGSADWQLSLQLSLSLSVRQLDKPFKSALITL